MERCVIIIPTFSEYKDICEIFIHIKEKMWSDCPYRTVLSVIGEDIEVEGFDNKIYIGNSGILTDCLVEVTNKFPANFYLCFLPDAFFGKAIKTRYVERVIEELIDREVDYCKLSTKRLFKKGNHFEKLKFGRSYGYSFAAFGARKSFIDNEMAGVTDIEFEKKYYEDVLNEKNKHKYDKVVELNPNVFNLRFGLYKGSWDRRIYRWLTKNGASIDGSKRKKLKLRKQAKVNISEMASVLFSIKFQRSIKNILGKIGIKFDI